MNLFCLSQRGNCSAGGIAAPPNCSVTSPAQAAPAEMVVIAAKLRARTGWDAETFVTATASKTLVRRVQSPAARSNRAREANPQASRDR